jgi:hypothetical protein
MLKGGYLLLVMTATLALSPLANAQINGWEEQSFVGHTRYSIEQRGESSIIKGEASGTSSVLYRRHPVDLNKTPIIRWRWKISHSYGTDINERSREGDDYPARLYVVVRRGWFGWQTLAVNYVWSSSSQVGDSWPSAYTDKSQMLVLQSGDANAGLWQQEQRNVVEDFKRLFAIDVTKLDGYAVMVDGDDTGSTGTAWFSDIRFEQE